MEKEGENLKTQVEENQKKVHDSTRAIVIPHLITLHILVQSRERVRELEGLRSYVA